MIDGVLLNWGQEKDMSGDGCGVLGEGCFGGKLFFYLDFLWLNLIFQLYGFGCEIK